MPAVALIRPDQVKVIHTLKSKAGLDDGLYRNMLGRFGVVSTKDLTASQAGALIDSLRGAAPTNPNIRSPSR